VNTVERRCCVRYCASLDGLIQRRRLLPVEVAAGQEFVAPQQKCKVQENPT
jgi:hypothetical protein